MSLPEILCKVMQIYIFILFARVVISWVFMFRPGWAPPSSVSSILDFVYGLTDPPVNYLRRFIPPLRSGAIALDLAFIVWFFMIIIVRGVICGAVG